jgi:hypothetical protein
LQALTHTYKLNQECCNKNLTKVFLEKISFEGTFEAGKGLGVSECERKRIPLCGCTEGKGTFTIGFSADAGNDKYAVVGGGAETTGRSVG